MIEKSNITNYLFYVASWCEQLYLILTKYCKTKIK